MLSKARIGSHPLHPMLIAIPITSYLATFAALVALAITRDPFWFRLALWANLVGVVSAGVAALPGLVDYLALVPKKTVARRTGAIHAVANVLALALFAINLYLLYDVVGEREALNLTAVLALSGGGVLVTLIAGWFGWEMVQRHHVGVLDQPDRVAVNDPRAPAATWMQPEARSESMPVTDSQVLDEVDTGRWPRDDESGRLPRH